MDFAKLPAGGLDNVLTIASLLCKYSEKSRSLLLVLIASS